jgi:hypothetical protein
VADPFQPDLSLWDAWTPKHVARVLEPLSAPWYIAAGWGIDLFLGGEYRAHDDIEVAVPRHRLREVVGVLGGYELFAVGVPSSGFVRALEDADDWPASSHQTWVRERETGLWRLDVLAEPSEGATWVYRRDPRIQLPLAHVIQYTPDGIPYGRPEVALLYKAKHVREKDERDFAAVLPRLDAAARAWLADALELLHPAHPWIGGLAAAG